MPCGIRPRLVADLCFATSDQSGHLHYEKTSQLSRTAFRYAFAYFGLQCFQWACPWIGRGSDPDEKRLLPNTTVTCHEAVADVEWQSDVAEDQKH